MTTKKQAVLDRAKDIYEEKYTEKEAAIKQKVESAHDIDLVEYTDEMIQTLLNDVVYDSNLFKRCIVPPFTILDTRQGEWTKRRAMLDEYLGSSLAGRKDGLVYGKVEGRKPRFVEGMIRGSVRADDNGTSKFDSLLCEVLLKWFGFPNCAVYDSFAGGHTRGVMSVLLGYKYLGIELSKDQVDANKKRFTELGLDAENCVWINDDSLNADDHIENNVADLFFSCPPYGDLEKYTDDPRDLSNMEYEKFLVSYREIIRKGLLKLKNNRFAVFVVGDFRDEKGFYRGFVKDTIQAFEDGGAKLYNELILLNSVGTGSLRASAAYRNRKIVKLHQNVLVFFKGDPSTIQDNYPEIDSSLPIPQMKQEGLF